MQKNGTWAEFLHAMVEKSLYDVCIFLFSSTSSVIRESTIIYLNTTSSKYTSESEVAQSCPTLCHPMDCSLPGSSVYGIFQTRIMEWVAISSSKYKYTRGVQDLRHLADKVTMNHVSILFITFSLRKSQIPREHFMQRWAQ